MKSSHLTGIALKSGRKSIHKDIKASIAFAKIPGNIPDSMTVTNTLMLLSSLHIAKAEIVTDNGYYSEDNILEMIRQSFAFVARISVSSALISPLVSQYQE